MRRVSGKIALLSGGAQGMTGTFLGTDAEFVVGGGLVSDVNHKDNIF